MKFCLGEQSRWLSSVTKLRPTGVKTASEQSLPAVFPKSSMKINKPHFQGYSEYKGTRWGLQWHNRSAFPKWKAYELEKCFYSQMTKMIFKSKSDSAVKPSFFIKPWEHPYLLWEVWEPSLAHLFFFQISKVSLLFNFLSMPRGMWHLSSPNQRLNLCALHWKHGVLTIGLPGKSL